MASRLQRLQTTDQKMQPKLGSGWLCEYCVLCSSTTWQVKQFECLCAHHDACLPLQVSIAKPLEAVHRELYIALLCVTTCMGLGLLTSARAGPAPITLW
jgi:hypothetical protein